MVAIVEGHASTYLDQPGWSAFRDGLSFGHGRLVIANKTHMRWEWYRNDLQRSACGKASAVRRAMELVSAGAARTVPLEAQWYEPLSARTVDDDVWIFEPSHKSWQTRPANFECQLSDAWSCVCSGNSFSRWCPGV